VDNSVDNYFVENSEFVLSRFRRNKMTSNVKSLIQAELLNRLQIASVQAGMDVVCDFGKGGYSLDIALHTDHFIYGSIAICDASVPAEVVSRFGIKQIVCHTIEDIEDCVAWAISLQNKHMVSQTFCMVA
jgi:hypothetical protein